MRGYSNPFECPGEKRATSPDGADKRLELNRHGFGLGDSVWSEDIDDAKTRENKPWYDMLMPREDADA